MSKDFKDMEGMFSTSEKEGGVSIGTFLNEMVATVVFFSVLLKLDELTSNPVITCILAGVGLFAGLMFDNSAHMNPAVSLMMFFKKNMNGMQLAVEIVAQVMAVFLVMFLVGKQ